MRQTFTKLVTRCQKGVGGDTSTTSTLFFKERINSWAETILALLPNYLSEVERTFSTVANQQYYHYPPNLREIENLMITVGSVDYPLTPIHSLQRWRELNAIDIQSGAIPRHYFKRQRDYGIWPIPQAVYTGTITYSIRAGGMTADDYTTGSVAVTENDATIVGSGTTFTGDNAAADRWFSLADSNGISKGSWYRILSITDGTNLELESVFEEASASSQNYIIGETPELPEDMHQFLSEGAIADYYAELRQSQSKAQGWSNKLWTGDWNNISRDPLKVHGGLLGAVKRYSDRDSSQLINRGGTGSTNDKIFAVTLSNS